jgi:hypothetical protein
MNLARSKPASAHTEGALGALPSHELPGLPTSDLWRLAQSLRAASDALAHQCPRGGTVAGTLSEDLNGQIITTLSEIHDIAIGRKPASNCEAHMLMWLAMEHAAFVSTPPAEMAALAATMAAKAQAVSH